MSRPPTNVPHEVDGRGDQSVATRLAIHDERFSNGQKAFAELREDMANIKTKVTPKPIQWTTLILGSISVLVTVLGVTWTLNGLFSDRPTRSELKETTVEQRKSLEELAAEQRTLRDQQIEQRVLLNGVSNEVKETSRKLDVLIDQVPALRATGNAPPRTPKAAPRRTGSP